MYGEELQRRHRHFLRLVSLARHFLRLYALRIDMRRTAFILENLNGRFGEPRAKYALVFESHAPAPQGAGSSPPATNKKSSLAGASFICSGGEGGIRTHGTI